MLTTDYPLAPRPANVDAAIKATFAVLHELDATQQGEFAVRLAIMLATIWPRGYEDTLPDRIREEGGKVRA